MQGKVARPGEAEVCAAFKRRNMSGARSRARARRRMAVCDDSPEKAGGKVARPGEAEGLVAATWGQAKFNLEKQRHGAQGGPVSAAIRSRGRGCSICAAIRVTILRTVGLPWAKAPPKGARLASLRAGSLRNMAAASNRAAGPKRAAISSRITSSAAAGHISTVAD